ncbi:unnamed protein product [Paramecium sonneborni]|uniref:Uncharacterized protein n=1 Tax=Paramecium sonneborni TaxID=65129 RepID=A0A8S1K814_9CILI|nr:unnamed protein product [Paramecium sonneborni]
MHLILILLAILVYWRLSTKQHQNYFEIHFIMMKNTTKYNNQYVSKVYQNTRQIKDMDP